MLEDVTLVEAYSQGAFPGELISALVEVLVRDLRQHTAAFIVDDTMVHITPH